MPSRATQALIDYLCDRIAYAGPVEHAIGRVLIRRLDPARREFDTTRRILAKFTPTGVLTHTTLRSWSDRQAAASVEYAVVSALFAIALIYVFDTLGIKLLAHAWAAHFYGAF